MYSTQEYGAYKMHALPSHAQNTRGCRLFIVVRGRGPHSLTHEEARLFKRNSRPTSPCTALSSLKSHDERVCLMTHQPLRSNRPCQPPPCNCRAQKACLFGQPSHGYQELCACWVGALPRGTSKRHVPWGRNHPARVVGQLAAYGLSSCLHTQLR